MTLDLDRARGALAALVGEAHVGLAPDGPGGPERLRVSPADEDELRATLATGAAHGLRVIPCGFGSKLGWTALTRDPALLVSTRRLSGVVSYEPADGTLSARAGTTMAALRERVLAGGHALTPDVPAAERATLGGVVAAGQSGFDRDRHGPVRHHVLGARVMLAATAPSWKMGRNMAITMPPTTTPRNTMSIGSISEVRAATVASHSVS